MPDLACGHYQRVTATRCGATPARRYLTGLCCPAHTPAALAGRPEPPAGSCAPDRCYCGTCPAYEPMTAVREIPRRRIQQLEEKGAA
jgi:hypothetical protein